MAATTNMAPLVDNLSGAIHIMHATLGRGDHITRHVEPLERAQVLLVRLWQVGLCASRTSGTNCSKLKRARVVETDA